MHQSDRCLVEKGIVTRCHLVTLRTGEWVVDNVVGRLAPLEGEVVKIRGRSGQPACLFYEDASRSCGIYPNRPLECRVLKCWDTQAIERVYTEKRLRRRDLIAVHDGLWRLVQAHEHRCPAGAIPRLADALGTGKADAAAQELFDLLLYDEQMRRLVADKAGVDPRDMDFLFGRPASDLLRACGFVLQRNGDRFAFAASSRPSP